MLFIAAAWCVCVRERERERGEVVAISSVPFAGTAALLCI